MLFTQAELASRLARHSDAADHEHLQQWMDTGVAPSARGTYGATTQHARNLCSSPPNGPSSSSSSHSKSGAGGAGGASASAGAQQRVDSAEEAQAML